MLVAFYLSQIFIGILGFGFVLSAILIAVFLILLFFWLENKEYKASSYYQITKTPLYAVKYNVGKYGEYLIYKYLNEYETIGAKFLFNVYIPKKNGETTEIDVLMISHKGIYVFESKNFSGWIFGDEKQKYWYQTLPIGRRRSQKEKFFNPILQNRAHISHLQSFLDRDVPIKSLIIFSERCTFKKIKVNSNESIVIKRDSLKYVFSQIYNLSSEQILTDAEVENIYARLYPYTQVNDDVRLRHVKTIHEKILQQTNNTNSNSATNVGVYSLISEPQKVPTNIETPLELNKPDSSNDNLLGHIEFVEQDKKCPRCNGNLVLRTATKGVHVGTHFYGCTNYPRCKFIMNITKES